jgi:diguanylate cyclase (GGDEF)-like protein
MARWLLAGLVACLPCYPLLTAAPGADWGAFITHTDRLRLTAHAEFEQRLGQLHAQAAQLSPGQRWHLRYLDGWEALYEGRSAAAGQIFRDVVAHAGDKVLVAKSSAWLLSQLVIEQRYQEAFEQANRLTVQLPTISDPEARYLVLLNLSQAMGLAGQTRLAVQYAGMMEKANPSAEARCLSQVMQVEALFNGKQLALSDPLLARAADACSRAGQTVPLNTVELTRGSLYLAGGQPRRALAVLDRIAPSIRTNHFAYHIQSELSERARAYAALGDAARASAAARAVVAQGQPGDYSDWLREANHLLYTLAKQRGDATLALAYHEQYAAQEKGYLSDLSARSMAYQTVQQHVLAQQMETENLSQQNTTLRMQQALAAKTAEANRLYIVLLLLALAFGTLAMFRLRRSQLRFQRMARLDGLTATLNHQHFMSAAESELARLEKHAMPACLIYLDLDFFKRVNDTHGHAAGDEVLQGVAESCRSQLRSADLFGRLGGEEFGILLVDCPRESALDIAERVRQAIASTVVMHGDRLIMVSASVGLVFTDASGYNLRQLRADADAALYRAKDGGRDRLVAANEESGSFVTIGER